MGPPPLENRVFVAVPEDCEHGMITLLWALENLVRNGDSVTVVHVHRAEPETLRRMGENGSIEDHRKKLRAEAEKKMDVYVEFCKTWKVNCKKLITDNDDVAKGLQELIESHGITKLVMGDAADERYIEKMESVDSKTAIKLMEIAASTCKIWFTCNRRLICTSEKARGDLNQHNVHGVNEESILTNTATQNITEVGNEAEEHVQMPREMEKSQGGSLHEKNDEITAMALPAETLNTEFSSSELMQAMERYNNTLMGEGKSGEVYRGFLRNTDVAIKWLHRDSVQGESDFNQKVGVLGLVRHPNLVMLIGVCRAEFCLVYEFLPNGSLEDRLASDNKMPPLTWQVRTKIIYGMWSALAYLHSYKPQPVVHGDLKPSNVLLDANFVSKLADLGICSMDGGDPTTQSDVRSFGVIVLQLLTGLPPEDVAKVVEGAMEKEELHTVLDPTAGNWPFPLAKQLADVSLRCVKMMMSRPEELPDPDLVRDVWKVLESHKNAGFLTSGQDDDGPPNYFLCPITWDVMENPYFATDGHTYEYEVIKKWINGDHGKHRRGVVRSPMTNLKLEDSKLTPNLALRSEINEWKEKHQQQKQVRSLVCDPNITPPEEAQSQPLTGLLPQVSSSPPTTMIPSLTDDVAGSRSPTRSPNTALPPASNNSPPTTLIPSTADAHSRSTAPVPLNTAAARSHRFNPLPANSSAAAPPPPPPPPSPSTFLPPPAEIRRRHVNGRTRRD